MVRINDGLELLVDSQCAHAHKVELLVARMLVVVHPAAKRAAAESTRVAESGGARDHGISTYTCEEVDRLARGKTALSEGSAELDAEKRFREVVNCQLDECEKAVGKRKSGSWR